MSDTATTIDLKAVQGSYLAAWNSTDAGERRKLLTETVSDDVVFADPMKQLTGRDALAEHIADVRKKFTDVLFAPEGDPDEHNGYIRQRWVATIDGETVLRGLDVDDVGPDGRLTRIIGFFDQA